MQLTIGNPQGIDMDLLIAVLETHLDVSVTVGQGFNGLPIGMLYLENRV